MRKVTLAKEKRNKGKPWAVRWFEPTLLPTQKARRYCKSFSDLRAAQIFQSEKTTELLQGLSTSPTRITLQALCKKWEQMQQTKRNRWSTQLLYNDTTKRLLNHFGGGCKICDISPAAAQDFVARIKPVCKSKLELSTSTQHRILRQSKAIFAYACRMRYIPENPFTDAETPTVETKDWQYFTAEQYRNLLAKEKNLRWRVLISLCYCGGLRLSEALNLKWDCVNLKRGEVVIQNQPATETTPHFNLKGKKAKARTVPLPDAAVALVSTLRLKSLTSGPYVVLDAKRFEAVKKKWQMYRQKGIQQQWRPVLMLNNSDRHFKVLLRKAGIKVEPGKRLSMHDLRKAAITNWLNNIPNPKVAQVWAGHGNIATTMKFYSQVTAEQRDKGVAAMNRILKKQA